MLARSTDPDTSHDAAAIAALSPGTAAVKSAIMQLLRENGPRTAFELRALYAEGRREGRSWPDVQPNSINRRVSDLKNIGLLVDTERRRKTPDFRDAIVWRPVTRTERDALIRYHGLAPLIEVEVDWQKVSDVKRLRARIAELEATVRGLVATGAKLEAQLARAEQ